jgi:hypothetical protein
MRHEVGKVCGWRVRRKHGEMLIKAFVPRKLRAASGFVDGEFVLDSRVLCNSVGVGKSWGRLLYVDVRLVVECCGGMVRSA